MDFNQPLLNNVKKFNLTRCLIRTVNVCACMYIFVCVRVYIFFFLSFFHSFFLHTPIRWACSNLAAVRRPGAPQQILRQRNRCQTVKKTTAVQIKVQTKVWVRQRRAAPVIRVRFHTLLNYLFKVVDVALEYLHTPLLGSKRPNIPNTYYNETGKIIHKDHFDNKWRRS